MKKILSKSLNISTVLIVSSLYISGYSSGFDNLNATKKDILNYSYQKIEQDSKKLKKDWINPITYSYIYNNGEKYTTSKSMISVSQPIFKSGGIFDAIKYAASMKQYSTTSTDIEKNKLIKQLISILLGIKKLDLSIEKQKLSILNSTIEVNIKKEQVLNGVLDSSFLNNAIIALNVRKNILIDLEYQKELNINNLKLLSDKSYTDIQIPIFKLNDKNQFLKNNIYIKQQKQNLQSSYFVKNMTIENYLPSVHLTASYSKYHDIGGNKFLTNSPEKNIGFKVNVPLDIKFTNNIASAKLQYFKNKAVVNDQKEQEKVLFENKKLKLKFLDKKIKIAKDDYNLYDSLVKDMIELYNGGLRTKYDLQTMENSKKIKAIEIESLTIDKQLELLELYSRESHE